MRSPIAIFLLSLLIIGLTGFSITAQTRMATLTLVDGQVVRNVEIVQEENDRIQIRIGGIKSWIQKARIEKIEDLGELPAKVGPAGGESWKNLWKPNEQNLSDVQTVIEEGREWERASTRYFRLHFTQTSDREKVLELVRTLDNLYEFLHERTERDIPYPIKVYLIPGQSGNSRCDFKTMSMYTGDNGDFEFNLTSYMHEMTHLFNKDRLPQGYWSGEFMCIYNQYRMKMGEEAAETFFRKAAERDTADWQRVAEIDRSQLTGKKWNNRLFLGAAIYYFIEETYGAEKLREFWDWNSQPGSRKEIGWIFKTVFGKDIEALEREYYLFYQLQEAPPTIARQLSVSETPLSKIVIQLSSDKYHGRKAGDPACENAAGYIAQLFRDCGLSPLGDGESFLQTITVPYTEFETSAFRLKDRVAFIVYKDYRPVCGNRGALVSAPIVFVGYGLSESDRDDYKGMDVKGKIALALRGVPEEKYRGTFSFKVAAAARHGALGLLIVDTPGSGRAFDLDQKVANPSPQGIPALHISTEIGNQILAPLSLTVDHLETRIKTSGEPYTFDTGMNAEMSVKMQYEQNAQSSNVIGLITGGRDENPKDYYLICAHYDGQGRREQDRYFPGANDNASGVAALVGAARSLQPIAENLDFSVIFAAWTGEEIGRKGSEYFCQHPEIPLKQIRGVINLDMVGVGSNRKVFVQTPDTDSPFYLSAKRAAKHIGINLNPLIRKNLGGDAYVFAKREIPTLFFLTGEGKNHRETDTEQSINRTALDNVAKLTVETLIAKSLPPHSPHRDSSTRDVKPHTSSSQKKPSASKDTSTIVVEEGVGFGEIVFDNPKCTREFIMSKLGPPDEETENWLGYRQSLGMDFLVYERNYPLKEIRLNPGFQGKLSSGIHMSSSMNDVFRTYGQPAKEERVSDIRRHFEEGTLFRMGKTSRILYKEDGLMFWFATDRITQIVVFK